MTQAMEAGQVVFDRSDLDGVHGGSTAWDVMAYLTQPSVNTILVLGASGNVGSMIAQIAVGRGMRVIGTGFDADLDYLDSLGVEPISCTENLTEALGELAPAGVDAVADTAGSVELLREALRVAPSPELVVTCTALECVVEDGVQWAGRLNL